MKILRLNVAIDTTGLARSTIYKLIGEGGFPRPIPLVGRSVGWVESEVHEWIKSRVAQRELMDSSLKTQ
ncbi:helix-turn-helix transcriptional regulator [Pseudomonas citronellolis]|uniref:helix-turn-helix transcriptional regulator n=1 Tax=Pseudomonas citronellolis TaxID=53408 RepID=UPI0009F2E2ED|nr:AlpA family transcriptional regulator [Pseudomonas humi]